MIPRKLDEGYFRTPLDVIIPTIGRLQLAEVIESILDDIPQGKIILVSHYEDLPKLNFLKPNERVAKIVVLKRSIGLSLNAGLKLVEAPFFALFSDDDSWPIGKYILAMKDLSLLSPNEFLLGSAEVSFDRMYNKIRPKKLLHRSASESLKVNPILPNPFYISLTTFIGPKTMSYGSFNENISFWEDMLWLLKNESQGFKPKQVHSVFAKINISSSRAAGRQKPRDYIEICKYLDELDSTNKLKTEFLLNIAPKNLIASGEYRLIIVLLRFALYQNLRTSKIRTCFIMAMSFLVSLFFKTQTLIRDRRHLRRTSLV